MYHVYPTVIFRVALALFLIFTSCIVRCQGVTVPSMAANMMWPWSGRAGAAQSGEGYEENTSKLTQRPAFIPRSYATPNGAPPLSPSSPTPATNGRTNGAAARSAHQVKSIVELDSGSDDDDERDTQTGTPPTPPALATTTPPSSSSGAAVPQFSRENSRAEYDAGSSRSGQQRTVTPPPMHGNAGQSNVPMVGAIRPTGRFDPNANMPQDTPQHGQQQSTKSHQGQTPNQNGALIVTSQGERALGSTGRSMSGRFYNYSASHVPPLQLAMVRAGSFTSGQASSSGSRPMTDRRKPCANILVLGPRQVGKSNFINAYRSVNTSNSKWPVAPVGVCGKYGTTSLDPCPNNPQSPSWILVDTPGRLYANLHSTTASSGSLDSPLGEGASPQSLSGRSHTQDEYDGNDALLLTHLFSGLPWKTRLQGHKSLPLAELGELPTVEENRPHHCVVVLSARELLTVEGSRIWPRYVPSPALPNLRKHMADFLEYLRHLLGERAPFIVVTHMDNFSWRKSAEARIRSELRAFVPVNRLYFVDLPESETNIGSPTAVPKASPGVSNAAAAGSSISTATRTTLLQLHQDILSDISWCRRSTDAPPPSGPCTGAGYQGNGYFAVSGRPSSARPPSQR